VRKQLQNNSRVWQSVKSEYSVDQFHGESYWSDEHCYVVTGDEAHSLEVVSAELQQMFYDVVDDVIRRHRFAELNIPKMMIPAIVESWKREDPSVIGCMQFAIPKDKPIRFLGYSAENPVGLLEASLQWRWFEFQKSSLPNDADQFNRLEELLVDFWRWYQAAVDERSTMHFTSPSSQKIELEFIRACAELAGWKTRFLELRQIGWNGTDLVDDLAEPLRHLFKLATWRDLMSDPFAAYTHLAATRWFEPPWKMILASDQLLSLLWEIFPKNEHLIPSYTLNNLSMRESVLSSEFEINPVADVWIVGEIPAALMFHEVHQWDLARPTGQIFSHFISNSDFP
jgi:glutathionylspermidine synthase